LRKPASSASTLGEHSVILQEHFDCQHSKFPFLSKIQPNFNLLEKAQEHTIIFKMLVEHLIIFLNSDSPGTLTADKYGSSAGCNNIQRGGKTL
jgi:hypothetical protein